MLDHKQNKYEKHHNNIIIYNHPSIENFLAPHTYIFLG